MNTVLMDSKNNKTSNSHTLLLNLWGKIILERSDKYVVLSNIHIFYTRNSYKNNEFKIPAPTWKEKFELPDGSYSISDIQD